MVGIEKNVCAILYGVYNEKYSERCVKIPWSVSIKAIDILTALQCGHLCLGEFCLLR